VSKQNVQKMVEHARLHVEGGEFSTAETLYRMIMKASDPPTTAIDRVALGEACDFMAQRSVKNQRHGEACDWWQRAVHADPLCVDYRLRFIVHALLPMNMLKNAKIEAEIATRMDPQCPDAWRALGLSCAALGEEEAAAEAYDMQVSVDPDNPRARIDRAALAINVGDYVTAADMAAPLVDGDLAGEALHVMGMIAYRESRHEEAIALYEKALASPGNHAAAQIRWNMSLALHAIGRYAEGWPMSEARGDHEADESMRLIMNRFQRPKMTREHLNGPPLVVHVHQEMGHGDALATVRYLTELQACGHTIRLETLDSLVSLFARSFPGVEVGPRAMDYPAATGLKPFDVHIPTLSLPDLFGTTIESVPWRGAYIKPDPYGVALYGSKLPYGARKIGLCWSSGIREGSWIGRYGRAKSMHLKDLAPLLTLPDNPTFVNLQIGPEREQIDGHYTIKWVTDILPKKPTWDETAALLANLDVVVTVDTAIAHLAGAMGKPTYLIMQRDGGTWHFMCERPGAIWNEKSPWYPSIRIFRQKQQGVWCDPVEAVIQALKE